MINKTGAKVTMANDGREGCERAMAEAYHVILMDIQMPHMDGHDAVRVLRQRGLRLPIVALTAHAMNEERERAERSDFLDLLSKPLASDKLYALLARFDAERKGRESE